LPVAGEFDFHKRQRGGQLAVIERRRPGSGGGIHNQELCTLGGRVEVPKSIVLQPVGPHIAMIHQRRDVVAHEFLGARVVGSGECGRRLRKNRYRANGQHDD
jgi:hypothetical protein